MANLRLRINLTFPRINKFVFAILSLIIFSQPVAAQRRPVLPQIDLPHPYYYRELYLPQLTSGPSSVAWSPDSKEVVYSMAGSLWRQRIDSTKAVQLTDGPGYDYQPDWSPDGKCVVYVSYQKDAMELWLLDLASGKTQQLTHEGAVNVEPRWSPDGTRIVFVSTAYNKRFHIFRADVRDGKLENVVRLTESRAHSRDGRILENEGGAGCGGARDSLRGDELESAAGFFAGWIENGLQLLFREGMAPALGDAGEGRRCVCDFLRELG